MPESLNHRADGAKAGRRELRAARRPNSAAMLELREFLGQMRGKPPQEVLGLIAQSSLLRGMLWSTALVFGGLMGITLVVWGVKNAQGHFKPADQQAASPQAADPGAADPGAAPNPSASSPATAGDSAGQPPAPAGSAAPNAADQPSPSTPRGTAASAPRIPDPLGIGETKLADPKINPLENRADDILNELDKR